MAQSPGLPSHPARSQELRGEECWAGASLWPQWLPCPVVPACLGTTGDCQAQPHPPLRLSNLVIYVGPCRRGPPPVPISLIYCNLLWPYPCLSIPIRLLSNKKWESTVKRSFLSLCPFPSRLSVQHRPLRPCCVACAGQPVPARQLLGGREAGPGGGPSPLVLTEGPGVRAVQQK